MALDTGSIVDTNKGADMESYLNSRVRDNSAGVEGFCTGYLVQIDGPDEALVVLPDGKHAWIPVTRAEIIS